MNPKEKIHIIRIGGVENSPEFIIRCATQINSCKTDDKFPPYQVCYDIHVCGDHVGGCKTLVTCRPNNHNPCPFEWPTPSPPCPHCPVPI